MKCSKTKTRLERKGNKKKRRSEFGPGRKRERRGRRREHTANQCKSVEMRTYIRLTRRRE
jgi:hypothetical protein